MNLIKILKNHLINSIYFILGSIYAIFKKSYYKKIFMLNKKHYPMMSIHSKAILGEVYTIGNIIMNEYSYMNSGQLITGKNSKIIIGKWCAIGYDVKIMAATKDLKYPTGPNSYNKLGVQRDTIIEDYAWIGSNVFIKEGVRIGEGSIIGANSVVTKDVPKKTVYGGVPARLIRKIK